jgi:hypothetical protein
MSQGKYSGEVKGYTLIALKKSRPMAQDIMALIQKTYIRWKKKLSLEKKYVCYVSPIL